jgi:hypothetical protein
MFAKFEVRRLDLPAARKILGTAIGMCPKEALFKGYIQLEFEVIFHFFVLGTSLTITPFSFVNSTAFGSYTRNTSR